jgi:hypothetical protein
MGPPGLSGKDLEGPEGLVSVGQGRVGADGPSPAAESGHSSRCQHLPQKPKWAVRPV